MLKVRWLVLLRDMDHPEFGWGTVWFADQTEAEIYIGEGMEGFEFLSPEKVEFELAAFPLGGYARHCGFTALAQPAAVA